MGGHRAQMYRRCRKLKPFIITVVCVCEDVGCGYWLVSSLGGFARFTWFGTMLTKQECTQC